MEAHCFEAFGMQPGEGLTTDMRTVRKDHDQGLRVDQWNWEKVINEEQPSLPYLLQTVEGIWKVIKDACGFRTLANRTTRCLDELFLSSPVQGQLLS